MRVGDIVTPIDDRGPLRSGAEWWPSAVVVQISPLVLVSEQSDMRWQSTVQDRKFIVVGHASDDQLKRCMRRLEG